MMTQELIPIPHDFSSESWPRFHAILDPKVSRRALWACIRDLEAQADIKSRPISTRKIMWNRYKETEGRRPLDHQELKERPTKMRQSRTARLRHGNQEV